ncbi:MAG: hypothetical protein QXV69_08140 [Sulfolobaceae archaeon]
MIAQIIYDKIDENLPMIYKTLRRIPLVTDIIFTRGKELAVYINGIKVWDSKRNSLKELKNEVYSIKVDEELSNFIFPFSS